MAEQFLVPDIPQPIVGYKAFIWAEDGPLYGYGQTEWPVEGLRARCDRRPTFQRPCGDAPCPIDRAWDHIGYGCGIYAYRDPETLARHEAPLVALTVITKVELAGRVYEYVNGYRAERGRIIAVLENGRPAVVPTAEHYGVPIEPFPLSHQECRELFADQMRLNRNAAQRFRRAAARG